MPEIVTVDAIAVAVEPIADFYVVANRGTTADSGLPTPADVVVLVDRRIVTDENELVGVPSIAERGGGVLSQVLHAGDKPAFGAFPGIERAVELVGAERPIAGG